MGKRPAKRSRRRRRLIVERLDQRRVLAAISGTVFGDANHSFQIDHDELGSAARLIYIDANLDGQLDAEDSFAVANVDGTFSFTGLEDGTYSVRLFNGTDSQTQTFPIEASVSGNRVDVLQAIQLEVVGQTVVAMTANALVIGNLATGTSQTVNVGDQLTKMHTLPDGSLLVIGTDSGGDTTWLVNTESLSVTPVALTDSPTPVQWSNIALDADGNGVVLEQNSGSIYAVSISDSTVTAVASTKTASIDSQVLASETGVLTVFGQPREGGVDLSLWSNQTNSFLPQDSVFKPDLSELLAYDDLANVLAARSVSGTVTVFDTANGFEPLHSIDDIDGPITIDGARDWLMAISPAEAFLKIINLRDGDLIAELAIDLSTIGEVAAMAMSNRNDSVVVLGAAGMTEIALRHPTSHEIVISGGQDSDPVLFGVAMDGSNLAPSYSETLAFEATEDTILELAAPAALQNAFDSIGDAFVLLQSGPATNGTAKIGVDGSVRYEPNQNYFGTDSVAVRLHDGRNISEEFTLEFVVAATPDEPTDVIINVSPIPEDIPVGTPIGNITVIDVDGNVHTIEVDDPRFDHDSGQIIFIGGDGGIIDYEQEPFIPLTVSVTDPETESTIDKEIMLTIQDRNDPVTAITPTTGFIDENEAGDIVVELNVHDQDGEQAHFLTVDDQRFVVVNEVLQLAPGVEVDFEVEPMIVINITAKEIPGGGTYTEQFTVTVRDKDDTPQILNLTNKTVMEFSPGAVVGDVTVNGEAASSNFQFTVDDPRFEIDGSTLKLKDNRYLVRYNQDEVLVEIFASDSSGGVNPPSEEFVIQVLINEKPFHNEDNPYDVDGVNGISAVDALVIINYMSEYGPGPVGKGDPMFGYDVNADGEVTALDALLIINQLNRENNGTVGGSDGEGERAPAKATPSQLAPSQPAPSQLAPGWARPDDALDTDAIDSQPAPVQQDQSKIVSGANSKLPSEPADLDERSVIESEQMTSAQKFAEHVDRTLRLLSDDDV